MSPRGPTFPLITRNDMDVALWHIGRHNRVGATWQESPGVIVVTFEAGPWGWLLGRLHRAAKMMRALCRDQGACVVNYQVRIRVALLGFNLTTTPR